MMILSQSVILFGILKIIFILQKCKMEKLYSKFTELTKDERFDKMLELSGELEL